MLKKRMVSGVVAALLAVAAFGWLAKAQATGSKGNSSSLESDQRTRLDCERRISAQAARFFRKTVICYYKAARGSRKEGDFDLGTCLAAVGKVYDQKTQKLFKEKSCPACMVSNSDNLRDQYERIVEEQTLLVYCAPGDPLPGGGYEPPNPTALVCDRRVAGRGSTLLTHLLTCRFHDAAATAAGGVFDEAACEKKERTFYDNYNNRFTNNSRCPACLKETSRPCATCTT